MDVHIFKYNVSTILYCVLHRATVQAVTSLILSIEMRYYLLGMTKMHPSLYIGDMP